MSKFPTTEADVLMLANEMTSGLANNPTCSIHRRP